MNACRSSELSDFMLVTEFLADIYISWSVTLVVDFYLEFVENFFYNTIFFAHIKGFNSVQFL